MKYLLISNGIITNIIECTEATANHFNAKVFYDGAEIGAVYNPSELPQPEPILSTDERIATLEQENKLLTQQIDALSSQNDFQEELIVELANIVYA